MVRARNRVHRRWRARALRWTFILGAFALVGCTAVPRRDAPPTLFSSATPVGFPAEVRFLSTDRASVERQIHRRSAANEKRHRRMGRYARWSSPGAVPAARSALERWSGSAAARSAPNTM